MTHGGDSQTTHEDGSFTCAAAVKASCGGISYARVVRVSSEAAKAPKWNA